MFGYYYIMQHPILVIAVSLALVSFEVDGVDTISDKMNEADADETLSAKVVERRLNSNPKIKMAVGGLGDPHHNLGGHGHGHQHHPNKVRLLDQFT